MTYEAYVAAQARINRWLFTVLWLLFSALMVPRLSRGEWESALARAYPLVERARRESAVLAREFYDAERERQTGDDERHDFYLAPYEPGWFEEVMEPVRERMSKRQTTQDEVEAVVGRAEKEVENGGRRTQLWAVDSDPQAIGWARVQGGNESCAFCLMLISRGPVYKSAKSAGLDLDDIEAVELWRQIDSHPDNSAEAQAAYETLAKRWHPNCDCKVVPVFNENTWSGRDSYLAALELWKERARGKSGSEKLNALRRFLDNEEDPELDNVIPFPRAA